MKKINTLFFRVKWIVAISLLITCTSYSQIPEIFTSWKFQSDAINATPIQDDSTIYVGCMDSILYAIDKKTGKERWHFKTDFPITTRALIYDENLLFHAGCRLYSLNVKTGNEQWSFKASDKTADLGETTTFNHSSVIVNNGIVYFGDDWGNINGVDLVSGELKFQYTSTLVYTEADDYYIRSTPVIIDDVIYFGDFGKHVYAVSLLDSSEIWITDVYSPEHFGSIVSDMVVKDSLLFFGGYNNTFSPLRLSDGTSVWTFIDSETFLPSTPIFYDNSVIMGATLESEKVHRLNIEDGSVIWDFQAKGIFFVKPFVIQDTILVINSSDPFDTHIGTLYFLNINTGYCINEIHLPNSTETSAISFDSAIVVGKDDGIYCINYLPYLDKSAESELAFTDTMGTEINIYTDKNNSLALILANNSVFCDSVSTICYIEGGPTKENIQVTSLVNKHMKPGTSLKLYLKAKSGEVAAGQYNIKIEVTSYKNPDNVLIEREIDLVVNEPLYVKGSKEEQEMFVVYPNPFAHRVTFVLPAGEHGEINLSVYSIDGKLLHSNKYYLNKKEKTIVWETNGISTFSNTNMLYSIKTCKNVYYGVLQQIKH